MDAPEPLPNVFLRRLAHCVRMAGGKAALAKRSGISEVQLDRYLNGSSGISLPVASCISAALKLPPGWLMGAADQWDRLSAKAEELEAAANESVERINALLCKLDRMRCLD